MKVRFWGVRGSVPVPGAGTVRYGGNTSCIEVAGAGGECIVLDAGTGLRVLGLDLVQRAKPLPTIHLFISHTHWDHIQGFPFFAPCYVPGAAIRVKGPVHFAETQSLQHAFDTQMRYEFFPISNAQLGAKVSYESLKETSTEIGGLRIRAQFANHPILSLAYRLTENGRSVVYTGDHEPYHNVFKDPGGASRPPAEEDALFGDVEQTVEDANRRFLEFIRGAHVFVADCQYTPDEYRASKRGWGHSSWDYCLQSMKEAQVEHMILTHHDPLRTDQALDDMLAAVRAAAAKEGLNPDKITLAREGVELEV